MGYSKEELNWVKRSQSSVDLWLRVQTSDMNLTIYKVGPEIKLPCTVRFRFWHASFLAPPILAAKRIHFWQYSRIQLKSVFDCKYQRVFALNSSTASLQITNIYARKKKLLKTCVNIQTEISILKYFIFTTDIVMGI